MLSRIQLEVVIFNQKLLFQLKDVALDKKLLWKEIISKKKAIISEHYK